MVNGVSSVAPENGLTVVRFGGSFAAMSLSRQMDGAERDSAHGS